LLDIEFDKLLKGSERIDECKLEPAVLQRPPPGLNQGMEKLDLTWRYARSVQTKKIVDLPRLLSPAIGDHCAPHHLGRFFVASERNLDRWFVARARASSTEEAPAKMPSNRMQICALREQLDDVSRCQ